MLKVGVDAWNLPGDHRGVGRYVRKILLTWRNEFADRVEPVLIVPEFPAFASRGRYLRETGGGRFRVTSRAMHRFAGLDVLWFPFNGCSWTSFSLPAVATLHDATPFVFPESYGDVQSIMHAAVERCRALVTVSQFSRAELTRVLQVPEHRISAIYSGVTAPDGDARRTAVSSEPYVLFVGTTDRRKGIDVLIEAMRVVQRRYPHLELRLVGAQSDALPPHDGVNVRVEGFVTDAQLGAMYRDAALFAFPSLYEGFGFPPLEAMRFGTPVVAAASSAIPEILGDAAILVEPRDAAALAEGILRVMDDAALREDLRKRGLARAAALSWRACAAATLDVLERAAE